MGETENDKEHPPTHFTVPLRKITTMKTTIFVLLLIFFSFSCFSQQSVYGEKPTVSMKEYVDMQNQLNQEWMKKYIDIQFANVNDNVQKANASMDKRLDAINEFRGQLKDQAGTFITRNELWTSLLALTGLFIAAASFIRKKYGKNGINGH